MPVKSVEIVNGYPVITQGSKVIDTSTLNIDPAAVTQQQIDDAIAWLQDQLDKSIRLVHLPSEDPDRATDPARPDLFWSADGKYLVARTVRVVDIYHDGTQWQLALERVR